MQIKDSGIIIAGGGSGMGLVTAQILREKGARVGVLDLKAGGWDGPFAEADISDDAAVNAAVNQLIAAIGPVRGMLNTAGAGGSGLCVGPDKTLDAAKFRRALEVHTLGTFNICCACAEVMKDNEPDEDGERGVMITISSLVATEGQVGTAGYAAAKGGIASMTLPLAREFAPLGLRVMCISPGIFETPMFTNAKGPMVDWLRTLVQFPRRPGQTPEFSAMVAHIFENKMMNGSVLRIDGAYRVGPGSASHWTS